MYIKLFALALPVFIALDIVWIGFLAKDFYKNHIGFLLRSDIQWLPAILFYLVFILGLVLFVIAPAVEKGSWAHALLFGALFGLVAYATYDLTNLATLKDWPLVVTVVDMAWGAFIGATVSVVVYGITTIL
jgi:uncharacterized membrane protein